MRGGRKRDGQVRAGGAALLVLAGALIAVTAHLRTHDAVQPTVVEFCIAFVAVCAASAGAALLCEGQALFEEARGPRSRTATDPRR